MDDEEKFSVAYSLVNELGNEQFNLTKLYERLCEIRSVLNETLDEDLKSSRNSLAAGIKMLVNNGLIESIVPTNKGGAKVFALTAYEKTAKLKKSKHPQKEATDRLFGFIH